MSYPKILHALFLLVIFVVAQGLVACNTVSGAGQDISAAGQAIEKKAEQKKHY
ncbi:MAG: entericidin A/B family lipoprotein [Gammaproteobacteria bacterium]|nr:entericidin A/B family lipoprotein [Gammaproteobacteria bacterium]